MRAILDAILAFIGAASLTDIEYSSLDQSALSTDLQKYEALSSVLTARESVSSEPQRLQYYYLAKGVDVSAPDIAKSNILLGGSLCS